MEQKTKSLLKSRKVIYSISTLVVSLVVVILPRLNAGWTPEQLEMFKPLLLGTIALGLALLGGHTLTDMTAIKHSPPQYKDLTEAVKEALEVVVTEVDPESDLAKQLKKLFEDVGVQL
jgi:hypothetical protein